MKTKAQAENFTKKKRPWNSLDQKKGINKVIPFFSMQL